MLGSRFDLAETVGKIAETRVSDANVAAELDADLIHDQCAQLEREMVEMAISLHSTNEKIAVCCPVCDTRMNVSSERPLEEFVALDVTLHELECSVCGMTTGRVYHRSIGYHVPVD